MINPADMVSIVFYTAIAWALIIYSVVTAFYLLLVAPAILLSACALALLDTGIEVEIG